MIRPLNDRVVIKLVKLEETRASGIIIPEEVSQGMESIMRGDVVSSAIDEIKENDRILFKKYSPDIMIIDGEKYIVVAKEDILAKIDNDDEQMIKLEQDFEADTLQPNNPKFKKRYKK